MLLGSVAEDVLRGALSRSLPQVSKPRNGPGVAHPDRLFPGDPLTNHEDPAPDGRRGATSLQSGTAGLSAAEADRRLREFGPNQVEHHRGESSISLLLKEFTHFFAILLWIAAALAFWAEHEDPGQGMATLALGHHRSDSGQQPLLLLADATRGENPGGPGEAAAATRAGPPRRVVP